MRQLPRGQFTGRSGPTVARGPFLPPSQYEIPYSQKERQPNGLETSNLLRIRTLIHWHRDCHTEIEAPNSIENKDFVHIRIPYETLHLFRPCMAGYHGPF